MATCDGEIRSYEASRRSIFLRTHLSFRGEVLGSMYLCETTSTYGVVQKSHEMHASSHQSWTKT